MSRPERNRLGSAQFDFFSYMEGVHERELMIADDLQLSDEARRQRLEKLASKTTTMLGSKKILSSEVILPGDKLDQCLVAEVVDGSVCLKQIELEDGEEEIVAIHCGVEVREDVLSIAGVMNITRTLLAHRLLVGAEDFDHPDLVSCLEQYAFLALDLTPNLELIES